MFDCSLGTWIILSYSRGGNQDEIVKIRDDIYQSCMEFGPQNLSGSDITLCEDKSPKSKSAGIGVGVSWRPLVDQVHFSFAERKPVLDSET